MKRTNAIILVLVLAIILLTSPAYAFDYEFSSQYLHQANITIDEFMSVSEMREVFVAYMILELIQDDNTEFVSLFTDNPMPDTITFIDESGLVGTVAFAFNSKNTSFHAVYAPKAGKIYTIQLPFNSDYETIEGEAKALDGRNIEVVNIDNVFTIFQEAVE